MIVETSKRIQIVVDRPLLAELDRVASRAGVHRSHVIDLALRDFIHHDQRTLWDIRASVQRVRTLIRDRYAPRGGRRDG